MIDLANPPAGLPAFYEDPDGPRVVIEYLYAVFRKDLRIQVHTEKSTQPAS